MKREKLVMAAVCVMVMTSAGCGNKGEKAPKEPIQMDVFTIGEEETKEQQSTEEIGQGAEETQISSSETDGDAEGAQTDSELEEELKRYRQEREDNIQESSGLVEGGSPDEDHYSFDMSGSFYSGQFDTRETTEAYAASRIYVTDTLGIKPGTKMTTYMCIDPRILKIYDEEDKGVAAGYDNSNIFVCEYCNEKGVWEYLILVRDGKGSAWKVIHHGNSYKAS